ncbi:MAG: integrase arm-type DNA-binding domain-containing protein [Haliea sp.]
MPKVARELSALEVKRIECPGMHAVGGVAGLYLQVVPSGGRTWILRCLIGGKRREMGLGGFPSVTLALAREKARHARQTIDEGRDPIVEREAARGALAAKRDAVITFERAAFLLIASKSAEWSNPKHQSQWRNTLETYAFPVIGHLLVHDIALSHITQILEPIWTVKNETASRLRGRIEAVLDWATVRGYRNGDNPARWRGHLDMLLAKPSKVRKVKHHAAIPWEEIGPFMAELRSREGTGARALEFAILTAARSGEVRSMTWAEVDLESGVWTVPPDHMKAGKEHRIPLSADAIELLRSAAGGGTTAPSALVFPGVKSESKLSDMTFTAVLKRLGRADITAHGFRSAFRDWAGETTAYPREVIEHALAHQLRDKAEAAYARGTLFNKRRDLMDDWALQCRCENYHKQAVTLT